MSHYGEFDYLIINDSFEEALDELNAIVTSLRLETVTQSRRHARLIASLLG